MGPKLDYQIDKAGKCPQIEDISGLQKSQVYCMLMSYGDKVISYMYVHTVC